MEFPVDCQLGEDCYIQQYVDRLPGPGVLDIGCGTMANDGHKGTDFALPRIQDMIDGVEVLAAATGEVRGVRDGMVDISADHPNAPDIAGRECGNGVVIQHRGGWETQYCHLRQGSVAVSPGDWVIAGTTLGLIGLSGQSTFPHLHLSIRLDGNVVDPFRPDGIETCGINMDFAPMWRTPISYRASGILAAGLLDRVPEYGEVKHGLPEDGLAEQAGAIVAWAHFFAGREGDVVSFQITGPEGTVGRQEQVLERNQVQYFRAYGRRAPALGWPSGDYSATVTLRRAGQVLDTERVAATLP